MIFAELAEPTKAPMGIVDFLECAFFSMGFILAAVALAKVIRGKPPEPANNELKVRQEDLARRIGELEKIPAVMLQYKEQILASGSALGRTIFDEIKNREAILRNEMSQMHRRLDPVIENTAGIKGQMEAFTMSFENLAKILSERKTNS